ncbi:SAM-dependent methyltransferase [Streptomyces sp. NPDC058701]|uniref:SAM-dependent methyltransferase n=1 Tax=Streptomyces sp. NPDC058701 TaxID=3346608 RepID=UPI00365F6675
MIRGSHIDPYEEKVAYTYEDDPESWRKVLGDNLLFEWGVYDHPDSPRPVSMDEASVRFLDRQLEQAGLKSPTPPMQRILDVGCGWGYTLGYLARQFEDCVRLDGINVSRSQLEHCSRYLSAQGLTDRVSLYFCNALDIDLLPDHGVPYDLVFMRGVIDHFPPEVFASAMKALASRVSSSGSLVISTNLYNENLDNYQSAIPDEVDRLASGHRKTLEMVTQMLECSGFQIANVQEMPSAADVAHFLLEAKSNIEAHFPEGVTGALKELRTCAINLSIAMLQGKTSAYSIIATRP